MDQDGADVPRAECETGLLPVARIPDGALTGEQHHQLRLDPIWSQLCKKHKIDPLEIAEQEPDAGLGNGGLGRLAACFLDSMATLGIPGMGSGLRYEYGIFKQTMRDGWQHEQPDHWLARPDPWEVPRPDEAVQVRLGCSFDIRAGALRTVQDRPSTLIRIPYDRPVVGYGGRTINTLRLWSAATPDSASCMPTRRTGLAKRFSTSQRPGNSRATGPSPSTPGTSGTPNRARWNEADTSPSAS